MHSLGMANVSWHRNIVVSFVKTSTIDFLFFVVRIVAICSKYTTTMQQIWNHIIATSLCVAFTYHTPIPISSLYNSLLMKPWIYGIYAANMLQICRKYINILQIIRNFYWFGLDFTNFHQQTLFEGFLAVFLWKIVYAANMQQICSKYAANM